MKYECHLHMIYHLRASRQSANTGSSPVQGDLGSTTTHQTREDLATTPVPLGKLLGGHDIGRLAAVEAADEGGSARGATADVESPADEGTVLVGVEDDGRGGLQGDTVLEGLWW